MFNLAEIIKKRLQSSSFLFNTAQMVKSNLLSFLFDPKQLPIEGAHIVLITIQLYIYHH